MRRQADVMFRHATSSSSAGLRRDLLGPLLLLQAPHARVVPSGRQELVVRSALDDPAAVHDEDLVGPHHGRESMRDDERRASDLDALELGLDHLLRLRVERRSASHLDLPYAGRSPAARFSPSLLLSKLNEAQNVPSPGPHVVVVS